MNAIGYNFYDLGKYSPRYIVVEKDIRLLQQPALIIIASFGASNVSSCST